MAEHDWGQYNYNWNQWPAYDEVLVQVPDYMRLGICDYIFFGHKPGDFLCALFTGNFREAILKADDTNEKMLKAWAIVSREFPAGTEDMKSWCQIGGLSCLGRTVTTGSNEGEIDKIICENGELRFRVQCGLNKYHTVKPKYVTPIDWKYRG